MGEIKGKKKHLLLLLTSILPHPLTVHVPNTLIHIPNLYPIVYLPIIPNTFLPAIT